MKNIQCSTRFWLLLLVLLVAGGTIKLWERAGEPSIQRRALKDFPTQLGQWRQIGDDERFDPETEKLLRADDYVSRNFESNGHFGSLYIGYYTTQKNGATYHSPLNCLPGSGWTMSEAARIMITAKGAAPFEANRYVIQNANQRALLIYWYEGRGRAFASEYWAKIFTVIDGVRRRRSDAAMVRVMVPLGNSIDQAQQVGTNLAAETAVKLPEFVPN
jgi:EpsI family protein